MVQQSIVLFARITSIYIHLNAREKMVKVECEWDEADIPGQALPPANWHFRNKNTFSEGTRNYFYNQLSLFLWHFSLSIFSIQYCILNSVIFNINIFPPSQVE